MLSESDDADHDDNNDDHGALPMSVKYDDAMTAHLDVCANYIYILAPITK